MKLISKSDPIRFRTLLPTVLILFVFSACAVVGPDYVPPDASLPEAWHAQLNGGLTIEDFNKQALAGWWSKLDDPLLTEFIERAVMENLCL